MANKIIFLDVDGVLNNWAWVNNMWQMYHIDVNQTHDLNKYALCLLSLIVKETGAHVVISSSWRRIRHAKQRLISYLNEWNIPVAGETPFLGGDFSRGDEIQAWLDEHPEVERFVILDDDDDMCGLLTHLVQTDYKSGLNILHKNRAILLLNN